MKKLVKVVVLLLVAASVYAADFYKVNVTRIQHNVYFDNYSKGYIDTVACHEYVHAQEATLIWNPPKNKLVFANGHTCDVKGVRK